MKRCVRLCNLIYILFITEHNGDVSLEIAIFGEIAYREMQFGVDTKTHNVCFVRVCKTKSSIPVVCCVSHGVHFQTVKTREAVDIHM